MEWEIGNLGRGKYRLSLVRVAEGDTLCDVLDPDTAQACVVLSGELDVAAPDGKSRSVNAGKVAVMTGLGTFCLHASEDTICLRGSVHREATCNPDPPRRSVRHPSWGQVVGSVALGGAMLGSVMGLWMAVRTRKDLHEQGRGPGRLLRPQSLEFGTNTGRFRRQNKPDASGPRRPRMRKSSHED